MSDVMPQHFTLVLFLVSQELRHQEPTFAYHRDLAGVAEDPYQLIHLWWELPKSFRRRLEAAGVTPSGFQAIALALHREQTALTLPDGEVGTILTLGQACVCAFFTGPTTPEPSVQVVRVLEAARMAG